MQKVIESYSSIKEEVWDKNLQSNGNKNAESLIEVGIQVSNNCVNDGCEEAKAEDISDQQDSYELIYVEDKVSSDSDEETNKANRVFMLNDNDEEKDLIISEDIKPLFDD